MIQAICDTTNMKVHSTATTTITMRREPPNIKTKLSSLGAKLINNGRIKHHGHGHQALLPL